MRTLVSLLLLVICCLEWAWLTIFDFFLAPEEIPTKLESSSYDEHSTERSDDDEEDEEEEYCVVCLCKLSEREETRRLRCNHLFHKVCLDQWFASGHCLCPICRDGTPAVMSSSSSDHDQRQVARLVFTFTARASDDGRER
ncbi:hypothetical protein Tsubulata_018155 [Turnera subulata]|uniref:RING-type domain-containing protein n=1 Tax=Turnera subulata TaxID=218843 RepID=A0A9Q0JFP4_9ROSI|nr:hypothetical protein Tsubulata_018155 [Turnera subulata]